MESGTLKIFISFLAVSLWASTARPCGWYEDEETYRISMFRAELPYMQGFRPFYYSAKWLNNYFPDPEEADRLRNCTEWQKELGMGVDLNDIKVILYTVSPDLFLLSYRQNNLRVVFEGNSFIKKLLLPAYKEYLDYLVLAKKIEASDIDDPWEENDGRYSKCYDSASIFSAIDEGIRNASTSAIRLRYAFQKVKMYYMPDAAKVYDEYFANLPDNHILKIWAMLYKALNLDNAGNKVEANYLYAKVFWLCDEKKLRCYQCFNASDSMVMLTLKYAKNNEEKTAIWALKIFKNPGPALSQIQLLAGLSPQSPFLSPLIMREINKLEDWLFTPVLTFQLPSAYYDWDRLPENRWDYNQFIQLNKNTDLLYLRKFRDFLTMLAGSSKGALKDYCFLSVAHLYFLDDQPAEAEKYLAAISKNADRGILLQKNIDLLLDIIYSGRISGDKAKNDIAARLAELEKIAGQKYGLFKVLFSVTRKLSDSYLKINDKVPAGLLYNKSERYKYIYEKSRYQVEEGWYYDSYFYIMDYYWYIAWFDRHASVNDMDLLMSLILKKNKNKFETWLCDQPLGSLNSYKDLKGTIAFRNDDLLTAFKTFSEIPDSLWRTAYSFKDWLNEDPFIPKDIERSAGFVFSKSKFVKELIDLKSKIFHDPQNAGAYYNRLGDGYYNCTYYGNSWMMNSYGWVESLDDRYYSFYSDQLFGNLLNYQKTNPAFMNKFYHCMQAKACYTKALQVSKDPEVQAYATLMLHICEMNDRFGSLAPYDWQKETFDIGTYKAPWLRNFYEKYRNTKAFETYSCPGLDDFYAFLVK